MVLTSPHVERFSTAIAQLRDPRSAEAFRERQTAATLAAGIEEFGSTGLGLVRIACHGHGQIEGNIDSDGVVTTRVQLDQGVLLIQGFRLTSKVPGSMKQPQATPSLT